MLACPLRSRFLLSARSAGWWLPKSVTNPAPLSYSLRSFSPTTVVTTAPALTGDIGFLFRKRRDHDGLGM